MKKCANIRKIYHLHLPKTSLPCLIVQTCHVISQTVIFIVTYPQPRQLPTQCQRPRSLLSRRTLPARDTGGMDVLCTPNTNCLAVFTGINILSDCSSTANVFSTWLVFCSRTQFLLSCKCISFLNIFFTFSICVSIQTVCSSVKELSFRNCRVNFDDFKKSFLPKEQLSINGKMGNVIVWIPNLYVLLIT